MVTQQHLLNRYNSTRRKSYSGKQLKQAGNKQMGGSARARGDRFVVALIVVLVIVGAAMYWTASRSSRRGNKAIHPAQVNYIVIAKQLDAKIKKALPIYSDLRTTIVAIIKDPRLPQGAMTGQMRQWAKEERQFQSLVLWNEKPPFAQMKPPPSLRPVILQRVEALTNLNVADNILFQTWQEIVTTCNGSVSAYRPYLRAADAADKMAREDLAGKFTDRDYSNAIASEPGYYANAIAPADVCPRN